MGPLNFNRKESEDGQIIKKIIKKDTGQGCDSGLNGLQHPALKGHVLFGSHGYTAR